MEGPRLTPSDPTNPAPRVPPRDRIMLLGCAIDNLTSAEAVDRVFAALAASRGGWIFTPNLDILRRLTIDRDYAATTSVASLRLADGMPLIWASRLQGTRLPERIAGSEIIWSLCARAAKERRSVFFLGGNPGAAAATAARLKASSPGLLVAGVESPPIGFEKDPAYLAALEEQLRAAEPDLVLVGLPALKQDRLIRRLTEVLPKAWFAGIGVTFSFVAGEVRKPPAIIRRIGLEWFFRLAQEPRRLARRYLVEGIPFAVYLLGHSLWRRFTTPGADHHAPPPAAPDASDQAREPQHQDPCPITTFPANPPP